MLNASQSSDKAGVTTGIEPVQAAPKPKGWFSSALKYAKVGLVLLGTSTGAYYAGRRAGWVASDELEKASDTVSGVLIETSQKPILFDEKKSTLLDGIFSENAMAGSESNVIDIEEQDLPEFVTPAVSRQSEKFKNRFKQGSDFNKRNARMMAIGDEFPVNTYTEFNQVNPSIAVLSTGDFVVAWDGIYLGYPAIVAQLYDMNGTKSGSEFLINEDGSGLGKSLSGVIAHSDNKFVVVWNSYGFSSPAQGYGRCFDSFGEPIGASFLIGGEGS
jgi:hypothetical protein